MVTCLGSIRVVSFYSFFFFFLRNHAFISGRIQAALSALEIAKRSEKRKGTFREYVSGLRSHKKKLGFGLAGLFFVGLCHDFVGTPLIRAILF